MKTFRFFLLTALILSMTTAAMAQDEYGEAEGEATTPSYSAPAASTDLSTNLDSAEGSRSYPGFSIGTRLEIMPVDPTASITAPVFIEANVDIMARLSVFALVGFYSYKERMTSDNDPADDDTYRSGLLLLGLGGRFNFKDPQAGHAHLYASADAIFALPLVTVKDNGDNDSETEDEWKENNDRFLTGAFLGIEYLFVEEFGIAAEVGPRLILNSDKDNNPDSNVKRDYTATLGTAFALRITYHF